MRLEITFFFECPQANVARMLSNVTVHEHVVLHLRLPTKLFVAKITLEKAALRGQKVRFSMLLHVSKTFESSTAQIANHRFVRFMRFHMRVERLSCVKSLKKLKIEFSARVRPSSHLRANIAEER